MGSYNRKQCRTPECDSYIYDGCTVCLSCAASYHLCDTCGEDTDYHDVDCYHNPWKTDNRMTGDMQRKIDASDALVDVIGGMSVDAFMKLPLLVRDAYTTLQAFTMENGYKVNR